MVTVYMVMTCLFKIQQLSVGMGTLDFGSMMCIGRIFNHFVQYFVQRCGTQLYL